VLAGGRGPVEHAGQRAAAQALERERAVAQLVARLLGAADHQLVGELARRLAQLPEHVGDAHLGVAGEPIGLDQRSRQPDVLGLRQRPVEHRAADRLQQALAHLAAADPRQRVQARGAAGL